MVVSGDKRSVIRRGCEELSEVFYLDLKAKECNYPLTAAKVHQEKNQSSQRDESRQLVVKKIHKRAQQCEECQGHVT